MIFVSAGHYPAKPGVVNGEEREWEEAMVWASQLVKILGPRGFLVPTGTLREKVHYVNQLSPTIAVEIHFNDLTSSPNDPVRGSETLYYPGSKTGEALASRVQSALGELLGRNRGAKPGWYRMDPMRGPDFWLKKTDCPSLIIEPGFFDHIDEIRPMMDSACRVIARVLTEETTL
jgi:N-acetylmuramoyl-L-alanine amidase